MDFFKIQYTVKARMALVISQFFYKYFFKKLGTHSRIIKPIRIANSRQMVIGNNVYIDSFAFLVVDDGCEGASFIIDDNVKLGNYNHITCTNSMHIENNVLTADRVYISDNYHCFDDPAIPIKEQGVASKGNVSIGEGSWIGDNVSIISCRIGKHCVIGANSVVTHDVPDYSVAVGCPAKVIKTYNFRTQKWERTQTR
jgi:acetyltransferase-like isoleucine patch superfamily enzyme